MESLITGLGIWVWDAKSYRTPAPTMNAPTQPLTAATSVETLQQVVDRILHSRQITRMDQHLLVTLGSIYVEEQRLINLVFDRLRSGLIRVVD